MTYKVVQSRKSDYPIPIELEKDDQVQVLERSNISNCENWIKCKNNIT